MGTAPEDRTPREESCPALVYLYPFQLARRGVEVDVHGGEVAVRVEIDIDGTHKLLGNGYSLLVFEAPGAE